MKTAATTKRIREIINLVKENKLIPRPEFQRRLVWTREDKNHFLDSILRAYPFPEIYLADGDVNLETGLGTQLLVDGLQRVSTIVQYFEGDPDLALTTVPAYRDLLPEDKTAYLQYEVAVRDLGAVDKDELIEVFRRINSTKYSLKEIEINNAVYHGALKSFCEKFAALKFFEKHKTFTPTDYKRMGDLRYTLQIVITMMGGYFNRDDAFETYLAQYNDDFPEAEELAPRIERTLEFISECNFSHRLRIWKKADLFSLIVELDRILPEGELQPLTVVENVERFFRSIDSSDVSSERLASVYHKAALQASNDRSNRLRRGVIINGVIRGKAEDEIFSDLTIAGLIDTKPHPLLDLS